jgi:peroxiredoxin
VKLPQFAQLLVIALAAIGVYSFVVTAQDGERRRVCAPLCAARPNYAAANRLAPDFELPSLRGPKVRLSSYRGKVVILNFWTKTCRPCLEEMPSFADLAKALTLRQNLQLLTVSTDESLEDARATLQSVLGGEAPFEVLLDPDSEIVAGKYGTKLYPETWFIDSQGVIRARFDGTRAWSSALMLDLAQTFSEPHTCPIVFKGATPSGPAAQICESVGIAG